MVFSDEDFKRYEDRINNYFSTHPRATLIVSRFSKFIDRQMIGIIPLLSYIMGIGIIIIIFPDYALEFSFLGLDPLAILMAKWLVPFAVVLLGYSVVNFIFSMLGVEFHA